MKVFSPAWIKFLSFVWRGMGTKRRGKKAAQVYSVEKNSQFTKTFRNTWLAESKIKQEAILPDVTVKTTRLVSLNLLIIIQENGLVNVAFSCFHKGLEVILLDVFLKAVSRDFYAVCTSIAGVLVFCLKTTKQHRTVQDFNSIFMESRKKGW